MATPGIRLGIDLGGTKIEAVLLDANDSVLTRDRAATPQDDYAGTLQAVADLVDRMERATGVMAAAAGIGTPGSLSPVSGMMRNANSICLNGQPLDTGLSDALQRPIRLANDANCFALAEATQGAGRGASTVFGVIVGTGVGGGIVVDGKILPGRNLIGGEWGHNPLPSPKADETPGPKCYCGRYGCIEAWCSGPALAADHAAEAGMQIPPKEIVMLAAAGDMGAQDSLDRHQDRLARALAGVVNIVDPDVIVLGGGLSNMAHLAANLPGAMEPFVFSDSFQTPILKNEMGDSAGVFGAAWLWSQGEIK